MAAHHQLQPTTIYNSNWPWPSDRPNFIGTAFDYAPPTPSTAPVPSISCSTDQLIMANNTFSWPAATSDQNYHVFDDKPTRSCSDDHSPAASLSNGSSCMTPFPSSTADPMLDFSTLLSPNMSMSWNQPNNQPNYLGGDEQNNIHGLFQDDTVVYNDEKMSNRTIYRNDSSLNESQDYGLLLPEISSQVQAPMLGDEKVDGIHGRMNALQQQQCNYQTAIMDKLVQQLMEKAAATKQQLHFSNVANLWNPLPTNYSSMPNQLLQTDHPHHSISTNLSGNNKPNFGVKDCNSTLNKKIENEPPSKKPRIQTPSPLPTFKVRKEKLGDRVTALQQLVSPFGKTDTASVLHEAIDYIKFLHDQVRVLSAPYLKNNQQAQQEKSMDVRSKDSEGDSNEDLRSRGLCLVPISSTYPVASEALPIDFWTPTFGASYI